MHFWGWIQSLASNASSGVPGLANPYFLVGVGGAIGSVLRYGAGRIAAISVPGASSLLVTGTVNLAGSFLLGCVIAGFGGNHRGHPGILLLGVGICGGFTTFSTFAMELADLMHARQHWIALGYGLGSVLSGVVGFIGGAWVVQRWLTG